MSVGAGDPCLRERFCRWRSLTSCLLLHKAMARAPGPRGNVSSRLRRNFQKVCRETGGMRTARSDKRQSTEVSFWCGEVEPELTSLLPGFAVCLPATWWETQGTCRP